LEGEGLPVMPTAGAEKSSWEIFQKTYPSMKGQVDSVKKIYRELNDKLKMKGTKMTPQVLNACLVSEFGNVDNDELVNVFRRDPQIAQYALEILKAEVDVSVDSRMVPVDYHIADTDLEYRFDLDQFVEKIQYVAKEWNRTKDKSKDLGKEKYIAPYFCFIQSSGMGKTKLMYEFAKLTRKDSSDDHEGASNVSKDFSCDLILSSAGILVNNSNVFDLKIELRDLLRQDSNQGATDVANKIYECLEDELVTKRSTVREMKKTHVFLFDEAQELLETHYGFQAFLFRCIRTWLRKKRYRKKQGRTTVIAVFSGTSSAILNYTVKTHLLKDDDLKPVSPPRDSQSNQNDLYYYFRGSKTFEPFFTLTTMAVLKPKKEIQYLSDYDKSIRYGRPLFAKMHENEVLDEKLETVLRRLLLHTGEEGFDLTQHAESWLSVVATRVQMGCIKLDVVSKLVSKGYANLTGVSSNFATFIYMPDPVCARLAMCMMDDEWRLSEHQGKSKEWWSAAVKTLYSTGLCLPDKGDLGEVLTALCFLFCGDACRKNLDDNSDYKRFSVPLEDWIGSLQLSSESQNRITGSIETRVQPR
jgi:hypothetical protein